MVSMSLCIFFSRQFGQMAHQKQSAVVAPADTAGNHPEVSKKPSSALEHKKVKTQFLTVVSHLAPSHHHHLLFPT